MIDALLTRAATRFIFVVGKGGVGKTTTAGAIALALADRSQTTHLISTDPAHSIGDLFQQDLSAADVTNSQCSARLRLEEFSAHRYADRFFEDLRAPLIDLFERGTYLDQADATSFLDLSVPGIDEVMSALRLVDLYDSDVERVVIDTAPTGHTMRMLEAARTIQSWVAAGRAMAEKAGTVAAHLVGRRVPIAAEPLLADLEARARRFGEAVLAGGSAVVLTRAGDVVAAETARLTEYLDEHRIRVAARVAVFGGAAGDFEVNSVAHPTGCDGLRAWAQQLREFVPLAVHADTVHAPEHDASRVVAQWLASLEPHLLFVAGKGGVGKSTCAAAIGAACARSRRVCVVSADPAGSLSELLATGVGESVTPIAPNLYARQLDAVGEFERMRETFRDRVGEALGRVGLDSALQLDRNVIESLWDFAPPGIDELIALLAILEDADQFDVLVVDAAPTGHFLRLIELPRIVLDWVHSLLRLLVKYSAVGSLDALARDLLGFAKQLRQLQRDLCTPERAAVFVVTLDQPVVVAETERLASAIERAHLPVAAIILNREGTRRGSARERLRSVRAQTIVTPDMRAEIVGVASLRDFVERWEFRSE